MLYDLTEEQREYLKTIVVETNLVKYAKDRINRILTNNKYTDSDRALLNTTIKNYYIQWKTTHKA